MALKFLVKILLPIPPLNYGQRENKAQLNSNTEKQRDLIYTYSGGFFRVVAQSFNDRNKIFLADQALLLITSTTIAIFITRTRYLI